MYISWPTKAEGESKAPFSITTAPRCYSFLWIAPLTLDPYFILLSGSKKALRIF